MNCNLTSQNTRKGEPNDCRQYDERYVFFHVPHDGNTFPDELMDSICVAHEEFMYYHRKMRDIDARCMIPREYLNQCERFLVSRMLCDVERFIGPQEIMERYGMGFCYEKAYDGKTIKHLNESVKLATRNARAKIIVNLNEPASLYGIIYIKPKETWSESSDQVSCLHW